MRLTLLSVLLAAGFSVAAQVTSESENTLSFGEIQDQPAASIQDVAWIAGHWRGAAFGGEVEEIWSPPLGPSMMGSFKMVTDGEVGFYEILTIYEDNESLILRLKHFNSNLTGWEEKDETVDFKLIRIEGKKAWFDGMTFERIADDHLRIYLLTEHANGVHEMTFDYHLYRD